MTGKFIVAEIKNLESIPNADRIVSSRIYGETVIVGVDTKTGDKGLLIDCESALDKDLVSKLNMFRDSSLNVDKVKTGYIEKNCRVRPITLKGIRCSGLFLSEKQLNNIGIELPQIGIESNEINGVPICSKYIPPKTKQAGANLGKSGKVRQNLAPTFKEHFSTDQWGRNSHKVQEGDLVIITEKLHGTSFRCGNVTTLTEKGLWYRVMYTLFRLLAGFGWQWKQSKNQKNYNFVVGSRKVVKSIGSEEAENKEHFYNEDLWTDVCNREFKGKLRKGETIYGEIVGFTPDGELIMGSHSNEKLKKFMSKSEYKDFIKKYGNTTEFTYGCSHNLAIASEKKELLGTYERNKVFVYRITMTNEDGESIDLSWEQVKHRCEQLGVEHVPELLKFIINNNSDKRILEQHVETFTESDSTNFPQHLNEGVCVRIENGSLTPQIYKSKRFYFKVLENIIKDLPDNIDVEESN